MLEDVGPFPVGGLCVVVGDDEVIVDATSVFGDFGDWEGWGELFSALDFNYLIGYIKRK